MLDLVPPAAMAVLNGCVGVHLLRRGGPPLPHPTSVALCVAAPVVYGLGALLFLLMTAAAGRGADPVLQTPGTAIAALGTFSVPLALAFTVVAPPRPRALLVLMAALAWLAVWVPAVRPPGWDQRASELTLAVYVAAAAALSLGALVAGRGGGLERRLHVVALPLFAVGVAWLLLKSPDTRQPVFSTSVLVGGELMLLVLVADHLKDDAPSTPRTLAFQVLLLALGALLLLLVAINLRLFPRAPAPVAVAVVVATGLALAYGALRPAFDLWLRAALYPEAQRAAERIAALQAELEATRARLRATEHLSLVGQLAAEVAHEIKNPLGPIKGYARIIERDLEARGAMSDVAARGIAVIREEVEAIDARARRLLEAARPPRLTLEAVDLGAAVDDVLDLLRGDAPPGVHLAWRERPAPAPAEVDRLLLRSALCNVVSNAVEALGGRPGTILVALEPPAGPGDEGSYTLTVDDDGPGLPPDVEPEELFRPFASHKQGGTGLGLVIARGGARALGGGAARAGAPGPGARRPARAGARAADAGPGATASAVRATVAEVGAEVGAGGEA
ncbi:MAG: ATP-binding protein [Planctomycetes bacterium]|nr:ATP-binding protein [Planctomycetota bacterium]